MCRLEHFYLAVVDSTIISGLMSQHTKEPVKTFTIGFNEDKYDERKYARIASRKFKTQHFEKNSRCV